MSWQMGVNHCLRQILSHRGGLRCWCCHCAWLQLAQVLPRGATGVHVYVCVHDHILYDIVSQGYDTCDRDNWDQLND